MKVEIKKGKQQEIEVGDVLSLHDAYSNETYNYLIIKYIDLFGAVNLKNNCLELTNSSLESVVFEIFDKVVYTEDCVFKAEKEIVLTLQKK